MAQGWETVKPEIIKKRFRKGGVLDKRFAVPSRTASSCFESEDKTEIEPPPPKLRNLGEAVRNLEEA